MSIFTHQITRLKKLKKILLWFFAVLLFLLLAAWIFIQTPYGQNIIIGKVTKKFSRELNTKISIKRVDFSLFNRMYFEGVMVEDQKKDTLLYAGNIKVRITDWFFFKNKIELKYIGLEDALIHFHRTDSVWNHQFLFDYFSSPSPGKKTDDSSGVELNLKKAELKNIRFVQTDKWLGHDQEVRIGKLNLDARNINFKTRQVDVALLEISEPYFRISDYTKLKPDAEKKPDEGPSLPDSLLKWNAAGWVVNLDKLVLKNGTFKNDKQSETPVFSYFDGRHILFSEIDGTFSNVKWYKDTITTGLVLKTKERSGLEVKKMTAAVKFTPQLMEFSELDLQTNRSRIGNYYSMRFNDFDDMGYFLSRVTLTGDFSNTEIDMDDIAFFAPALRDWKKNISLTGKVKGTIEDLSGKNLFIKAGDNTLLNGDIMLSGLPDINTTFIDFSSKDFRTTYADAVKLFPSLKKIKTPQLSSIQYLHFKGNFTGFIRDFVAYGTTQTNLGTVVSDINMKLPPGKAPVYSGTLSTNGFNLGQFIGAKHIGAIAVRAEIKGTGFDKNVNADIDGKIRSLVYNNYHYEKIDINGKLNKQFFEGIISSKDSNAVFRANGTFDFNSKKPSLKLDAEIQDIQFQKLRIANEDYAFSGRLKFDSQGDNIDDFLGTAEIINGKIYKNGNELPFDSFHLKSEIINGEKRLTVRSDEFEGYVQGQYNINALPDAITLFLNKYYPAFIQAPQSNPVNQCFTFDITTRSAHSFLQMLVPSLIGFNESRFTGKVDMDANLIEVNANIPSFGAGGFIFNRARLSGTGDREKLFLKGSAANTKINDSISLNATNFTIEAANDISKVKIITASNKELNAASISAVVTTFDDGFKVKFDSSYFDINKKSWIIEKDGELELRRNIVTNSELTLREGEQEIKLNTEPSSEGSHNDLRVALKNLNLGDLAPFLLPKNQVSGLASGTVLIEDPAKKFNISSDLNLSKLWFDKDSIGNLSTSFNYNNKTGELAGSGKNDDEKRKIDFDMRWHLNKSDSLKENYIVLGPENYPIKILERFIGTLFTDLQGYATGTIKIAGQGTKMNYTGKAKLHDAGLKVIFTQCFYKIEDTEIELRKNDINLDGIVLRDPVTKNPVYLDGNISHSYFSDMFFDIRVQTRKPFTASKSENRPVLLLNTSYNDNKQFYGKAFGTGSLQLSGPQDDMFMQISAIASDRDSSYVTIPPSRSRESGVSDFLVERQFGREMIDDVKTGSATNIIYDADITATPFVTIKVQIDDLTKDEIVGRGEGTLNIRSGTTEPLTMRGRYNITDGKYDYTLQSVFKKPFEIKKGVGIDNYIEWSGDPYKARINFEAKYTAEKVSFAPLVSGYSINSDLSSLREDVIVSSTMYNELFNPRFNFKIEFPDNSQAKRDASLLFNISQIEKNQNELNRQVTFLIVFNSFAPPENSTNTGLSGAFNELVYNSISGILFNEVNNIINQALFKIFKSDKVRLNVSGGLYNRNILNPSGGSSSLNVNQGSVNVNLPVSLFKDRLIINAGFTSDISFQSNIQNRVQLLPNITMDLLINPSGSLRATIFYRENPDFLVQNSRARRQGVGITYKREANRFWDLFGLGRKRKPQPLTTPDPSTADVPKQEED